MTVAIEFRCRTCGKLLRTGEENAGRPAACPACGDSVQVPTSAVNGTFADLTSSGETRPRRRPQPHRGGLILAFGILAWMTCFLFGVAAWAMGVEDLRAMRAGEMDATGEGLTRAGMILGAVSVVLILVVLLGMIGFAGLAVALG
ncbi:MAG: zinc ribbon domain-containing protein [Planctomycetaceae bacterium]